MLNRFSQGAQETLETAQRIMEQKQQQQLDVEHMFLALLLTRDVAVARIIEALGGDRPDMARRLDKYLSNAQFGFVQGAGAGYLTQRAARLLQNADEEAARLGDQLISTEHLLLAISLERSGTAARAMQDAGIDHDKITSALKELRGVQPEEPEPHEQTHSEIEPRSEPQTINPQGLARPSGFNHGILASGGRLLFLAGQTALDGGGKITAPGDVIAQYRQVLRNMQMVVEQAGGTMGDIVKLTIFVSDRDDYKAHLKELGVVHKEFFGSYYPAIALLEISRFFDDEALVEIEGMAVISNGGAEADSEL